jgi:hypothetical protein
MNELHQNMFVEDIWYFQKWLDLDVLDFLIWALL